VQFLGLHLEGVDSQLGWLSRIFCPMSVRFVVIPVLFRVVVHLEIAVPIAAAWGGVILAWAGWSGWW